MEEALDQAASTSASAVRPRRYSIYREPVRCADGGWTGADGLAYCEDATNATCATRGGTRQDMKVGGLQGIGGISRSFVAPDFALPDLEFFGRLRTTPCE